MNKPHRVTLFGCGGWGATIARKLAARGDVNLVVVDQVMSRARALGVELDASYSGDPYGYLMVTGTSRSTIERGSVIVATPPDTRLELVRAILNGYGLPPARLRVEKPLAVDPREARGIVQECDYAGTRLSVGFTLLHDPLYETAFRYIEASGARVERVIASRYGRRARHKTSALVDLGSHAASIAAYLDAPLVLDTGYSDDTVSRRTQIDLVDDDTVYVDEVNKTVQSRTVGILPVAKTDALEQDLDAFLTDTHRAGPDLAIETVDTIDAYLAAEAIA